MLNIVIEKILFVNLRIQKKESVLPSFLIFENRKIIQQ